MVPLVCSALLLGTALGMRFRVYILVPALVVALTLIATVGAVGGHSISTVATAVAAAACGLQVGYLFGAIAQIGDGMFKTRTAIQPRTAR
jgi:hypothetical protein